MIIISFKIIKPVYEAIRIIFIKIIFFLKFKLIKGEFIKLDYITKKLGYKNIHFHCLRHSFSTNMYNGRMDMKELQVWLGHSSISTTMDTYLYLLDKKIK